MPGTVVLCASLQVSLLATAASELQSKTSAGVLTTLQLQHMTGTTHVRYIPEVMSAGERSAPKLPPEGGLITGACIRPQLSEQYLGGWRMQALRC